MEKSTTLNSKLTGIATMLSGLLWALGGSIGLNNESFGISMKGPHLLLTIGGLLSLIGMARLIRHQARDYGFVSELGAILTSVGVGFIVVSKNLPASTSDAAAWNVFYIGGLLLVIGSILFGTVVIGKSRLFGAPLLAIGLLSISNIAFLMGPFNVRGYEYLGTVLLPTLIGLGWSALGYALWSDEAKASLVAA